MRNWVHVWGTVVCMYAELGACLGNSCLHVCGIGCRVGELGACMRSRVHVCGVVFQVVVTVKHNTQVYPIGYTMP